MVRSYLVASLILTLVCTSNFHPMRAMINDERLADGSAGSWRILYVPSQNPSSNTSMIIMVALATQPYTNTTSGQNTTEQKSSSSTFPQMPLPPIGPPPSSNTDYSTIAAIAIILIVIAIIMLLRFRRKKAPRTNQNR
jgi:preprotein translocase subunit SecF